MKAFVEGPELAAVHPALEPLLALRPRLAAMRPEDVDLLAKSAFDASKQLDALSPSHAQDHERVRQAATMKAELLAAIRRDETLGAEAASGVVDFDQLRTATRYAALLDQLDLFRQDAGRGTRLVSLTDSRVTIGRTELLVGEAWPRHVEAVRAQWSRQLVALKVCPRPLPASYAVSLGRIDEYPIKPAAVEELQTIGWRVEKVVTADAALFAAYNRLGQHDDPLLAPLPQLLKRRLAASGDDFDHSAAEASALAGSDVWGPLAALAETNAIARVPDDARGYVAREAAAIASDFLRAPTAEASLASLAKWPGVLARGGGPGRR